MYVLLQVDAGVAARVKAELKARMNAHIAENPTEYQAPASVILKTMTSANLKVMFQISFTYNFCGALPPLIPTHQPSLVMIPRRGCQGLITPTAPEESGRIIDTLLHHV